MRYRVPKFISRESKIVGPLTFKQLGFLGGGAFIAFILYYLPIPGPIFWLITIASVGTGAALAFIRPQGRSLLEFSKSIFSFFGESQRMKWEKKNQTRVPFKVTKKKPLKKENSPKGDARAVNPLGKLKKLKSKLDTKK